MINDAGQAGGEGCVALLKEEAALVKPVLGKAT